jgi:hypothetical protein
MMTDEAANIEVPQEAQEASPEVETATGEQEVENIPQGNIDYDLSNPAVTARITEKVMSRWLNQQPPQQTQQQVSNEPDTTYEEADRTLTVREFQGILQQQQFQQQQAYLQQEALTHDAIINDYFENVVGPKAKNLSEEQQALVQIKFLNELNNIQQKNSNTAKAAIDKHKTFLAGYLSQGKPAKSNMPPAIETAPSKNNLSDIEARAEKGELSMYEALKILNSKK